MTLCITYKVGKSEAICISDSLLTYTGAKSAPENSGESDKESGAFLPSNVEVRHQTPHAVKVHIVSQSEHFYCGDGYDVIFSIAGNVSLGLQSILHLESYLQGTYDLWFDDMAYAIRDKIYPFWSKASDKEIELSYCITDHKGRTHIFEIFTREGELFIDFVDEVHGVTISVIGDDPKEVKNTIYKKITALTYGKGLTLEEATHIACVDTLKEKIDSEESIFIGGSIQGARLQGYKASYLSFKDEHVSFRGSQVEQSDRLNYPSVALLEEGYPITEVV